MSHLLRGDEFDERLKSLVHPPAWVNPTPKSRYHLVVIGAGTAGLVTAAGAAGLGARVALIERDLMGGDCLNFGCVPSKGMIGAARAAASIRHARQFGIEVSGDPRIDFEAVMTRMRRLRSEIARNDSASRFTGLGVDVFLGEGAFTGPGSIEVSGQTLRFKRAVIATGARPAIPEIPGIEQSGCKTNESVFSMTSLPSRLAVIGGGPIGCELAQAFARLGSEVTLVERWDQLLEREDEDSARIVRAALERDGVRVLLKSLVGKIETGPHSSAVNGGLQASPLPEKTLSITQDGKTVLVTVDQILLSVGRRPNVEGLNLNAAGVESDPRTGIRVDDRLRTTNPAIFAAGDVCSPYRFTHAADFMARIVIQNSLFLGRAKASALTIPWCTYTSPEVAHVGLNERIAKDRGIAIRTFVQDLQHVDRSILQGATEGFVKIHVKAGTDRIVGASIVAEHAGEMIGEIVLAMSNGIGLKRLASTIHPYPTVADAIRRCGDAYNRTRLTLLAKSVLRRWFEWTS